MAEEPDPLRIAIIGAGIGGLALAAAFAHLVPSEAIKVDVYERTHEIKEIGAGILAWPRTWKVLQTIGVAEALEQHLEKKPNSERTLIWKIIKSDQPQGDDIFEFYQDGSPSRFHRAAVQKSLLDSLPSSIKVHLAHRLLSYDETDEHVVLNFKNQGPRTCDLLVAADGIWSGTRGEFIRKTIPHQLEAIDPVWGGTVIYRALVDAGTVREQYPNHNALSQTMMYAGDGQYSVAYPIMQNRYIYVAALVTDFSKEGTEYKGPATVKDIGREHVLALFEGWSEEYLALVKNAESFSQWTIQYLSPLDAFASGRVALLGDAAHAMTPNLGSGAGQGIEDAYTLAHLILKAIKNDIPISRVTEVYSKTRQPLANLVLQKSDYMGRLASFRAPGYELINTADEKARKTLFERFVTEFKGTFDWWETHPVDKEVEMALNML